MIYEINSLKYILTLGYLHILLFLSVSIFINCFKDHITFNPWSVSFSVTLAKNIFLTQYESVPGNYPN